MRDLYLQVNWSGWVWLRSRCCKAKTEEISRKQKKGWGFLEKVFLYQCLSCSKSLLQTKPCQLCNDNSKNIKVHSRLQFPQCTKYTNTKSSKYLQILPNLLHKYYNMEYNTSCLTSTLPQSTCTDTPPFCKMIPSTQGWAGESKKSSQGSFGIKAPKGLDCISLGKAYDAHHSPHPDSFPVEFPSLFHQKKISPACPTLIPNHQWRQSKMQMQKYG